MTKKMRPTRDSDVLYATDESGSRAVTTATSALIDPQFLKEKEKEHKRQCSVGDVFLAASYFSLLLELSSSLFMLWCTSHPQSELTLTRITIAYYGLCILTHAILVANSVVELRDLEARKGEMTEKERRVKLVMEWLTVVSAAIWVVLCAVAIVMSLNVHNATLQYSSLVGSLIAPFLASIAGFVRVYDTYLSYKKEKDVLNTFDAGVEQAVSTAQKAAASRRAKSHFIRASLFGVISVFEALHFVIHIWEAYILVGNTHKYFYITEKAFIVSQVILGVGFVLLAVAERFLEQSTDADLASDKLVSLTAEQRLAISDDTLPLVSHEEAPAVEGDRKPATPLAVVSVVDFTPVQGKALTVSAAAGF